VVSKEMTENMICKTHRDLQLWKDSMDMVCKVYEVTKVFPQAERYGLISQLRRAAVSVPANISEGAGRQSTKEFIQFLSIARGSLSELEAEMLISERLDYVSKETCAGLVEDISLVGRQLSGLIRSLRQKK